MAGRTTFTAAALAILAIAAPAFGQDPNAQIIKADKGEDDSPQVTLTPFDARILELHNIERAEVGAPPLMWSLDLKASAGSWAGRLAELYAGLKREAA